MHILLAAWMGHKPKRAGVNIKELADMPGMQRQRDVHTGFPRPVDFAALKASVHAEP